MTPAEFQKRMTDVCKGSDLNRVALFGMNLVDEALGDNASAYLPAICDYLKRLAELKGHDRPAFTPPTRESIAAASKIVGEWRGAL